MVSDDTQLHNYTALVFVLSQQLDCMSYVLHPRCGHESIAIWLSAGAGIYELFVAHNQLKIYKAEFLPKAENIRHISKEHLMINELNFCVVMLSDE